MKLILANNQSKLFQDFYAEMSAESGEPLDYTGYTSLIFKFNEASESIPAVNFINLEHNRDLREYDGVYINGYLNTYELAASVAIACDYQNVGYVNKELENPASMSKLTMYAKLASRQVPIPRSIGGSKKALVQYVASHASELEFPLILKRADADRGIDNYMVRNVQEILDSLEDATLRSLWILQEFIDNHGYYLVSFYNDQPVFSIYREREERPDHNARKEHMYKPRGGINAQLLQIDKVPAKVIEASSSAVKAVNRQIASVDCLYDEDTGQAYILEVNYNPQLVTIETFKDLRREVFMNNLKNLGKH